MSLGLYLNVVGTAPQGLQNCISMSLGLRLNVFGTAPQGLRGLQVPAERLAALNPRLYNFQVGNFDYTDEELHLGQLQGKSLHELCQFPLFI